ncbi:FAD-binding protein [Halomonas urmiana]|uniref:FAD-binding protein n=1 Tax=Halomonas urmiana TaxID=490901 RepID=A0A5R8MKF5_9GAMM|nr:NAD(P)/FAD-dependent oxidoreductase [Halomonas urmiana]TLF52603.1 FAD-binding protein [Halomonas urmiana]
MTQHSAVCAGPARGDTVTVIGAGPAGLACAIVLARGGQRVIVHERRRRVGARFPVRVPDTPLNPDTQSLQPYVVNDTCIAEANIRVTVVLEGQQ